MLVKQKYSYLSEQQLYEWSLLEPTPFNRNKVYAYAYWHSIKELEYKLLTFDDIVRLEKISENAMRELKPTKHRR
jgi:hypothetical protein